MACFLGLKEIGELVLGHAAARELLGNRAADVF
jgi:hypothetical protein